jgi:hypothetical protein
MEEGKISSEEWLKRRVVDVRYAATTNAWRH